MLVFGGAAVEATIASIDAIQSLADPQGLVEPIITPRFIPACTDELLTGLGELADQTGLLVQTHCSESDWEHGYVIERFGHTDTEALDSFGLLRPSTVLAHAPFVTDRDLTRIAVTGAGVAHCPLSNVYFANSVFPARRALAAGVAVGLGTDIAGGPSASLLDNARQAVNSSRMLEEGVDATLLAADRGTPNSRIDAIAAFWLATMGGAQVLQRPLGLIAPGNRFDAIAVSTTRFGGWDGSRQPGAQLLERIVRLADSGDIQQVWVDGKRCQTRP